MHGDNVNANSEVHKPPHSDSLSYLSPEWLWLNWQGQGARNHSLAKSSKELADLVKTLDTFLLTASVGEFSTRLSMIGSFASESYAQALHKGSEDCLMQARVLTSLYQYYSQFMVFLTSYVARERQPLEERLRNEVKLAKWDEQSYYSLASSSEKNHRKLMTILRDYDEVLRITIATILEKELQRGIYSEDGVQTNTIPPLSFLFPSADSVAHPFKLERELRSFTNNPSEASTATHLQGICSAIARYSNKMSTILQHDYHAKKFSVSGYEEASDLCSAIFERIESLRTPKATRPMKERSLVDLFKTLRDQGYSSSRWNVPDQMRMFGEIALLPNFKAGNELFKLSAYQGNIGQADAYFFRCIAEMNRLNGEARMSGQNFMTQRQIEQMLSFSTHGMLLTAQQRSTLVYILQEVGKFQKNAQDLRDSSLGLLPNQSKLSPCIRLLNTEILDLCGKLEQLKMLLHEANSLGLELAEADALSRLHTIVHDFLTLHEKCQLVPNVLVLRRHADSVERILNATDLLHNQIVELTSGHDLAVIPKYVVTATLHSAMQVIKTGQVFNSMSLPLQLPDGEEKSLDLVIKLSSELVDYCRLATQICIKGKDEKSEDESTIWEAHRLSTEELNQIKLERLVQTSQKLLEACQDLQNSSDVESLLSCVGTLCTQFIHAVEFRLEAYVAFHRETAKLHYILLRIFRVLIARGFCTIDSEEKDGDGDGEVSGMKFEEQDGTGMGDGEGSQDVTDQIEDEEQLLGLKGDEDAGAEKDKPGKLNQEEADTGMEMENDFQGDLYDLPSDDEKQVSENEDGDQEEIDREMGDDASPNDEVIDKKLWDGSDDEQGNSEENIDKGGSMEGEVIDDEIITNEDQKKNDESADKPMESAPAADPTDNASNSGDDEQEQFREEYTEDDTAMNARDDRLQEDADNDKDDGEGDIDLDLEADADLDENEADNESTMNESVPSIENIEDIPGPTDDLDDGTSPDLNDNANNNDDVNEMDKDQQEETPNMNAESAETGEDHPEDSAKPEEQADMGSNENNFQEAYGIQSSDGKDAVKDDNTPETPAKNQGEGTPEETSDLPESTNGEGQSSGAPSNVGGSLGTSFNTASTQTEESTQSDAPNPFKSPGDVQKFWHKKLGIVDSQNPQSDDDAMEAQNEDETNPDGEFEYVNENQNNTTQALGEADETNENEIDTQMEEKESEASPSEGSTDKQQRSAISEKSNGPKQASEGRTNQAEPMDIDKDDVEEDRIIEEEAVAEDDTSTSANETSDMENKVTTDISRMNVDDEQVEEAYRSQGIIEDETQNDSALSTYEAQAKWNTISSEVYGLSRHICEKLRLVLEPLVATKLKGDYRTGKRINMKRVIGYIASGYRKDKIWLRRTKPAKRNYRVMVAVDDSESMAKNGAGDVALRALTALATGMSQLEIGEIGVAKFGNDMQIIHPFGSPFTSESGVNVMKHFQFDQARTRTALCVESALLALDDAPGDVAPMQLVLLISDGKVERDNKTLLRRLVREMLEKNILIVLVIVDGNTKKDSILTMKEVTFENGKPKVRSFMDDYPFPYYIILEDLSTLPQTLGDALRQWFEMIGELQF
jgi:midasin (ATPase involved in ribosome maturation)